MVLHEHHCSDLIRLFNADFEDSHNTCLVGGGEEPVYLPAGPGHPRHRIIFTRDYFASALHEVAHWCIAGPRRRQLEDYGYWYRPDGRDHEQQQAFERVEARPQAIEWAFSLACGAPFHISLDNLSRTPPDTEGFRRRVRDSLAQLQREGFPPRAEGFVRTLAAAWGRDPSPLLSHPRETQPA